MTQMAADGRVTSSRQVLIIDDSPMARVAIKRLLQQHGACEVTEADGVATGVKAVREAKRLPDCVLVDHHLPDGDARDVLVGLTGADGVVVCPVVVVSGDGAMDIGRASLRAGAQDFIGKGWMTPDSLAHAIENAIERWTLARDLRASEARFRGLASAVPHPVWLFDVEGRLAYCNEHWHAYFGPALAVAIGEEWHHVLHPDEAGEVVRRWETALTRGEPHQFACRLRRADGAFRWHQVSTVPLRDPTGAITHWYGVNTDVHALHEGAAKLEQSRHELQTIADHLPAIVSRFDRDLRHVFINSTIERVTGRSRTEFIGKTNRDLGMPEDKCDQWDAALRGVFATGQPASLTFEFPSPDGQRHFVNHIVPERGPDGTIEHALAVVTDVTELERTQHQLALALEQSRKATVAREQVLSLVSHDLKNPLATVMLAVGNLERQLQRGGPVDPNRVSQVLGRVLSQSQRMRRMIDELLDVAWLQSGEALALERRATDLVALVHTLVEEEQRATSLHRFEVDAVLPTVTGRWDPHRIERVVANLIANAIKYSPNGGRVRCEVKVEPTDAGAWAVLRVCDQGIGISHADIGRVFEWYGRGENARRSGIRGTGIGLASARSIVEQHGGTLTVTSVEGHGSTFEMSLPLEPGSPST